MQIIESTGLSAICRTAEGEQLVDMRLLGAQPAGSWVLVFLGAARELLSEQRAGEISRAVQALEAVMNGAVESDVEALFADLNDREPQLPAHLRPPE